MLDRYDPRTWSIPWDAALKAAIGVGLGVAAALILHRLLFALLMRISRRTATPTDGIVYTRLFRPVRWAMAALAVALVARSEPLVRLLWDTAAPFVSPALLGWIAYALVAALSEAVEVRSSAAADPVAERSHRTRMAIFSRTATFAIVFITIALRLFQVPGIRQVGATLLASAGLAALAVGAAAQPALKSLIAGIQMAITEPLRIGDLVVVDGNSGRVEEIRMSFVVVRMWDERAAIVPTSRFLDQTFENWSRISEMLTGPVFLHLDPATEVEPIRQEFIRFLGTQERWDRRTGNLKLTEARADSIELRLAMSAATIGDLFELRCAVREHMLAWLRANQPAALIHHRLEMGAADPRGEQA
ncbi:MAG: mechanosensitive ion channel family protein [Tsuneonella sp.]